MSVKQGDEASRALQVDCQRMLDDLQRGGGLVQAGTRPQRGSDRRHQQRRGHPLAADVPERQREPARSRHLPVVEIAADLSRGQTTGRQVEAVERRGALRQERRLHPRGALELGLELASEHLVLTAEAARTERDLDARAKLALLDRADDQLVDAFPEPAGSDADIVARREQQNRQKRRALELLARADLLRELGERDAVEDAQIERLLQRVGALADDHLLVAGQELRQQAAIALVLDEQQDALHASPLE